jgi:UDP-N-acetylmuramyl tripeptide synthase
LWLDVPHPILAHMLWLLLICPQVPLKAIVAGIEAVEVIPGRSEVVDEGQEFSVIVDAADNPQVSQDRMASS